MNAYQSYIAAKHSGWAVLRDFVEGTKGMGLGAIEKRDGITPKEAKQLRLTYERLKPCAGVASDLALRLDVLHTVAKTYGKLRGAGKKVLEEMLRACVGKTLREAEADLTEIFKRHYTPRARNARLNFANQPNEDGMLHFTGLVKEEDGRQIQAVAEPVIKTLMKNNPGLRYDQALGIWAVKAMRGEVSQEAAELPTASHPIIILSGDPNVDVARGHLNTLAGGSIPLAEAVNQRLAGTGYAAWTRHDDAGVVHLDAMIPIRNERFSTGVHRIGVVLENLVCAHPDCDRPAITCQAHHINSVAYHQGETSWENLVAACAPHNAQNDDNPNAPPRNGRLERGPDGWVGQRPKPGEPLVYNPNPKFREGYRGTAEAMAANVRRE